MLDTFLKQCERTIAAGQSVTIPGSGNFIFVETASFAFDLQFDDRRKLQAKGKFKLRVDPFREVTFFNKHATKTIKLVLWIGAGDVDYHEIFLPQTQLIAQDVNLADGASMALPGVNSDGQRRKQITVTLRPNITNTVQLFNTDTGKLLALIGASSSGGGFCIETDDDLTLKNKTGVTISSTIDVRDIAVAETWYIN